MARYRRYKNGIIGNRYRGLYVVKGERKGAFVILNEDKTVFKDNLYDFEECRWEIDKEKAGEGELAMMKSLYSMEIYQLSAKLVELMRKREAGEADSNDEEVFALIEKVRRRKAEDRPF